MNFMNTHLRQTTVIGLAAVGFVALVAAGIWLAIYAARFAPRVVNSVGGAAVYLGSVLNRALTPDELPGIATSTVPSTIDFGGVTGVSTSSPQATSTGAALTKSGKQAVGPQTNTTYQIGGTVSPSGVLSGLPDLEVSVCTPGYLETTSTSSFVASSTVPAGRRPAVRFTIRNVGTNTSGSWRFSAFIPTRNSYLYQSQLQQSLLPGDSIEYILGFDQANPGANQTITITANFDHAVAESATVNNSISTKLTILGS